MESGFRSTDWQQLTFAVVGMGLIGGSYAKALRRLGVKKIIGVDTDGGRLRNRLLSTKLFVGQVQDCRRQM